MKKFCGKIILQLLLCVSQIYCQCLTENDNSDAREANTDLSGITDFSLDLFREIFPYNSTHHNFFFSPYSIYNALALAYFGSKGETEKQLAKVLKITDKIDAMKQYKQLQFMYKMRQINKTKYTFNIANKVFFDDAVTVRDCMKNILPDEVQIIDFDQSQKAAQTMNDFVARTTKHRITEIVTPEDLRRTKMALVNAAFFKGVWQFQFKKSKTRKELFYATPENFYEVDMMYQKGNFRSGPSQELGAYLLEMPYSGEDISMVILLPPFLVGDEGFNQMVKKLNGPMLHDALNDIWRGEVEVAIPKFKLEQKLGNELVESLGRMGVKDLFDQSKANMSGFSINDQLYFNKAIHKAFVKVSEEGTEAAAATALIQFRVARPLLPEKFICNHPFMFLIFDNENKNILFMGAYKNPSA